MAAADSADLRGLYERPDLARSSRATSRRRVLAAFGASLFRQYRLRANSHGQKQKPERSAAPARRRCTRSGSGRCSTWRRTCFTHDDDENAAENVIVLDDAEPPLAQRRALRAAAGALAPGSSTDASVVVGVDPALLADTNAVMDHLFCRESRGWCRRRSSTASRR